MSQLFCSAGLLVVAESVVKRGLSCSGQQIGVLDVFCSVGLLMVQESAQSHLGVVCACSNVSRVVCWTCGLW